MDALVNTPLLALTLEGGLEPTSLYAFGSAKYSLVFMWSALVINEMEIGKTRPRWAILSGRSGRFRRGHNFKEIIFKKLCPVLEVDARRFKVTMLPNSLA